MKYPGNKFSATVTQRLKWVRIILALGMMATLLTTWPLWTSHRLFPSCPIVSITTQLYNWLTLALCVLLLFGLSLMVIGQRPVFFIFISLLSATGLLLLDQDRFSYWFVIYLVMLLILATYNWRVDNIHHYSSVFNALRLVIGGVYLLCLIHELSPSFLQQQWPDFILPFGTICTPEQVAYLEKLGVLVPVFNGLILLGFLVPVLRVASLGLSICFHLISIAVNFSVRPEPAVLIWNMCMILFVLFLFAGNLKGQKVYTFSIQPKLIVVLLALGVSMYALLIPNQIPLKNRIDFMDHNTSAQFLYVRQKEETNLPLYVRSFIDKRADSYSRISLRGWVMNETHANLIFSPLPLQKISKTLQASYHLSAVYSEMPSATVTKEKGQAMLSSK